MKYVLVFGALLLSALTMYGAESPPPPLQAVGGVSRFNLQLEANSHQDGMYVHYRNFAAFEWRNDVPDRAEGQKHRILAEYNGAYLIVWYYDGSFRASNGSKWGTPARWAYLRIQEEVWDGRAWVMPDGSAIPDVKTVTYRADDLQRAVDFLMDNFTVPAIQDAMDRSKSYFPKSGAPN